MIFEKDFETFVLDDSNDSEDFEHTDLVTMDIEIGDSLPISQKPYNISLKHTAWYKRS